jgi:hypothetical protein
MSAEYQTGPAASGVRYEEEEGIRFRLEETSFFTVKSHVYESTGLAYHEYTSHRRVGAWPLVHVTFGRNPVTGRRKIAVGIVAIGRIALGFLPIGQLAIGLIPIGQLSIGLIFALGQAAFAPVAVGQLAVTIFFGLGQIAVGYVAIGQLAAGYYALGQLAVGVHVYSSTVQDPAAVEFFRQFLPWLGRRG